jgi:hypothetical protein
MAPACLSGGLFDDYCGQSLEVRGLLPKAKMIDRRPKFGRNVCVAASATQTATGPRWRRSEIILFEVRRFTLGVPQRDDI